MASYQTIDNHEDFRRESAVLAEQFCERLAQLLTHCFDRTSSGEKLLDLFDDTASLGRELLFMIVGHCHSEATPPLALVGEHYDKAAQAGRLLFLTLLRDGESNN